MTDAKDDLQRYLVAGREALRWKLDGVSEYDARRPLTPTGTNLLGIVKHVAGVELEYFGPVFGRPTGISLPWASEDAEPNADMWARPDESRVSPGGSQVAAELRRSCLGARMFAGAVDPCNFAPTR